MTNNNYYVYNKYVSNIANGNNTPYFIILKLVLHPGANTYKVISKGGGGYQHLVSFKISFYFK